MENDWTADIECVLENIRQNCVVLSNEHKTQYFYLKYILQFFRLPVIIISGVNSIVSVGFQPYLNQGAISITTCILALTCSIIGSIELYLAIQKGMEVSLVSQQSYYLLGVDIYKNLSLSQEHRPIPAKEYLERCYNEYVKLTESSNAIIKNLEDKLAPLPVPLPKSPSFFNISTPSKKEKQKKDNAEDNVVITLTEKEEFNITI
jgi:hypothetical protein